MNDHRSLRPDSQTPTERKSREPVHSNLRTWPFTSPQGEGVNEETTTNLDIEEENLEVPRLLQKAYCGCVKVG
jgi:hypothetical protein